MDTVGIIAPKQWGKTTLTKHILNTVPRDKVIILDSNNEYKGFNNRFLPESYDYQELERFIKYGRQFTNITLIMDDVDLFVNPRQQEGEFKKLLINASHQNIGVIYSAKRAETINKLLFMETKHLFMGSLWSKKDIYNLSGVYKKKELLLSLPRYAFLYRNRDTQEESILKVTPL